MDKSCDCECDEEALDAHGGDEEPGDNKQMYHAWSVVGIDQEADGSATYWGVDMPFHDGESGAVRLKRPARLQYETTHYLWTIYASWICWS